MTKGCLRVTSTRRKIFHISYPEIHIGGGSRATFNPLAICIMNSTHFYDIVSEP